MVSDRKEKKQKQNSIYPYGPSIGTGEMVMSNKGKTKKGGKKSK